MKLGALQVPQLTTNIDSIDSLTIDFFLRKLVENHTFAGCTFVVNTL